jgi:hypothetical protein
MDLSKLQAEVNRRWALQLDNPCHASADADHAFVHLTKALGKIASAMNDAAHEKRRLRYDEVAKYLADLVICAARFGEDVVDLDAACVARLAEKFPIDGPHEAKASTINSFYFSRPVNVSWRDESATGSDMAQVQVTEGDAVELTLLAVIEHKKGADGGMYPCVVFRRQHG